MTIAAFSLAKFTAAFIASAAISVFVIMCLVRK